MRTHGFAPGACGWLCNGQCHRTWKTQLECTEIRWTTWIENPRRRWRRVAHNATSVNAQRIVGNNIGGLHPSVGVHVCTKFSWLNYFDGWIVAASKRQRRSSIAVWTNLCERSFGRRANSFIFTVTTEAFHFLFEIYQIDSAQWWSEMFVTLVCGITIIFFYFFNYWWDRLILLTFKHIHHLIPFQQFFPFKFQNSLRNHLHIQLRIHCHFNVLLNFVFVWNFRWFSFSKFHEK